MSKNGCTPVNLGRPDGSTKVRRCPRKIGGEIVAAQQVHVEIGLLAIFSNKYQIFSSCTPTKSENGN